MNEPYIIYLDVCCLNRPFDSWEQARVRFEGEAIISILDQVEKNKSWQLVSSEAIEAELEHLPNPEKLTNILALLSLATSNIVINNDINRRSQKLEELGFGLYDAFHIACAESARADILLTTDDRLLKRVLRYSQQIQVTVSNPVNWLMTVLEQTEGDPDNDTH